MSIVSINTKDEMQKVLAIQKMVSEQAVREIAIDQPRPDLFIRYAARTLEKYARYATLTEYAKMPHLADSEKWGASFGVASIVGALILEQSRQILGVESNLRVEYLRFLADLDERRPGSIEMNALYRIFAVLSDSYGIIWTKDEEISLTVTGRRVYLHILDAMKFVEEVTEATAKFKN